MFCIWASVSAFLFVARVLVGAVFLPVVYLVDWWSPKLRGMGALLLLSGLLPWLSAVLVLGLWVADADFLRGDAGRAGWRDLGGVVVLPSRPHRQLLLQRNHHAAAGQVQLVQL